MAALHKLEHAEWVVPGGDGGGSPCVAPFLTNCTWAMGGPGGI